jgi:hypothetical protein
VVVAAGFVTDRDSCRYAGRVRISIAFRNGSRARGIRGNPSAWRARVRLGPWSELVHVWRWTNWCRTPHRLVVTARAGARSVQRIAAPHCLSRRLRSRFADLGTGTKPLPFTGDRIPAHILGPDVPPPLSPALIRVVNGWLVSDGRTLVAVYAGESGAESGLGVLAILRQNLVFGLQTCNLVTVGRIGGLRITTAPAGEAVEKSAQHGAVGFTSDDGVTGTLELRHDTTRPRQLSRAPCG